VFLCSSSVFDYNQTHLNIEEDQNNEQVVVKTSESVHPLYVLTKLGEDILVGADSTSGFKIDDRCL